MIFSRPPLSESHGIKRYTEHSYYWGVSSRDEMRSFLATARATSFEQAEATGWSNPKLKTYTTQWDRADFHFFLPLDQDACVLDLGSGYGNNTIPLARHYKHVIAADATHELLEYTSLRAAHEGINNIEFVNIDPLEYANLPFAPGSFDAIIVSGLLEWVGPAKQDTPPEVLQQQALTYLRTLLKEHGVLYVAIENRWFPGYILRDPHSKLKYTCVLPRRLADWYARSQGHSDGYRTYIHSKPTYTRMLKKAGFTELAFLYPQPNYRNPGAIVPDQLETQAYLYTHGYLKQLFTKRWQAFLRLARLVGLDRFFLSSFMMIASSMPIRQTPSLVRQAIAQGIPQIEDTDRILRIINRARTHEADFLVFHKGASTPYGHLLVNHNPQNAEESRIVFTNA